MGAIAAEDVGEEGTMQLKDDSGESGSLRVNKVGSFNTMGKAAQRPAEKKKRSACGHWQAQHVPQLTCLRCAPLPVSYAQRRQRATTP